MHQSHTVSHRPEPPTGLSNGARHPLDTKDSNAIENPFVKRATPIEHSKPLAEDDFTLRNAASINIQPEKKSNMLSPKPAGVMKSAKYAVRAAQSFVKPPKAKMPIKLNGARPEAKQQTRNRQQGLQKGKEKRTATKAMAETKVEHPLSLAFKEVTLAYQTQVESSSSSKLALAVSAIVERLAEIDVKSSEMLATHAASVAQLTKPFETEHLVLTKNRGMASEHMEHFTIGERMHTFTRFVNAKEDKLKDLWGRWDSVTEEISKLQAGLDAGNEQVDGSYAAKFKELDERYRANREQVIKKFDDDCEILERKAVEIERKYEATCARQRQAIKQYMELEAEVRNDSDEEHEDDEEEENEMDDKENANEEHEEADDEEMDE